MSDFREQTVLPKQEKTNTPESREGLNFDDLCYISKELLALRHVSSRSKAQQDKENGFYGDALATASISNLLDDSEVRDSRFKQLPIHKISKLLSEETKERLLKRFKKAVQDFILNSIGIDVGINIDTDDDNPLVIQKELIQGPTFLLVDNFYGSDGGYDTETFGGLGKCGKKRVKPEQVTAVIGIESEDIPSYFSVLETKATAEQLRSLGGNLSETLYGKFSSAVHKAREQK